MSYKQPAAGKNSFLLLLEDIAIGEDRTVDQSITGINPLAPLITTHLFGPLIFLKQR